MDTRNYDRLRKLARLRYFDSDKYTLASGKSALSESHDSLRAISDYLPKVMTGEALTAAQRTLGELTEQLAEKERLITAFIGHHENARASMRRAAAVFDELPTVLVDHGTEQMVRAEDRLFIDGSYVTSDAYLAALRYQANAEREAKAAAALATMNGEVKAYQHALAAEDGEVFNAAGEAAKVSAIAGGIGAAIGGLGAATLRSAAQGIGAGRTASGVVPTPQVNGGASDSARAGIINRPGVYRRPPASGPGSRMEPINDPKALRHLDLYETPINPRMSSDGPIGGYLPAPITDGADPRWSSEAARAAANSSRSTLSAGMMLGGGGGLAAGVFGRGAMAGHEGRAMGAGGLLGGAGVTGGRAMMGAGSSAALGGGLNAGGAMGSGAVMGAAGRMPMVGGMPASGLGGVGMSGAGAAGMNAAANGSAANGMTGLGRVGAPGGMAPAASAPGAPGAPGAFAPGAGMAGSNSERKGGKDRVGYEVVRVDDDERRPITLSEGAGAGSSATMKPMRFKDTDDSWE